jgi:NAD(P)-dependent dehydrogenase (short-subunit alcohol dehydrogenase family)
MQTQNYQDKVVFITGAGGAIGCRISEKFAEENAKLIITNLDKKALYKTVEMLQCEPDNLLILVCDVSNEAQVQSCIKESIKHFGCIDVAINNAGIIHKPSRLAEISTVDFLKSFDVNAKGVFLCMKYQLDSMMSRKSGIILNISSSAGRAGAPYLGAYAASKHAVVGLTRTSALEYARFNIRVNALCPSYVNSPMLDRFINDEVMMKKLEKVNPMSRFCTIEEVANAVLWLCSDYNTFMTGETIALDGGLHLT